VLLLPLPLQIMLLLLLLHRLLLLLLPLLHASLHAPVRNESQKSKSKNV
jgi:hypothetical protein